MGPRQSGKTTGVLQFLNKYKKPYYYCSADDLIAGDRTWILEQWQIAQAKSKDSLLIIDEIQKIENWAETVKKLWDNNKIVQSNIKLLLLGSSSLSLLKGISESLAGRFETINVYHWDFFESKELAEIEIDTFLEKGGYPKSYDYLKDSERWLHYVRNSIIDRVIAKDTSFMSLFLSYIYCKCQEIVICI